MMTPEKVHMLRCASSLGVAEYGKYTPHFSGLARLASGARVPFRVFCGAIHLLIKKVLMENKIYGHGN